jgi:hypothetical protein
MGHQLNGLLFAFNSSQLLSLASQITIYSQTMFERQALLMARDSKTNE